MCCKKDYVIECCLLDTAGVEDRDANVRAEALRLAAASAPQLWRHADAAPARDTAALSRLMEKICMRCPYHFVAHTPYAALV